MALESVTGLTALKGRPRINFLMKRFLLLTLLLLSFAGAQYAPERDADVPDLPFADNPDPSLCGIPEPWNEDDLAHLNGFYEGQLVQSEVLLYDSHSRRSVEGYAPTGTPVEIVLVQVNPVLNYYLVRTVGLAQEQEGWVPGPFLEIEDR